METASKAKIRRKLQESPNWSPFPLSVVSVSTCVLSPQDRTQHTRVLCSTCQVLSPSLCPTGTFTPVLCPWAAVTVTASVAQNTGHWVSVDSTLQSNHTGGPRRSLGRSCVWFSRSLKFWGSDPGELSLEVNSAGGLAPTCPLASFSTPSGLVVPL